MTLQQSVAALTAKVASMSACAPAPCSPGPTTFVNTDAVDPFDRFRNLSANTGCSIDVAISALALAGGDAQRATQIARASVLSGAGRLGALAAIDPGSDNQPPPFFNVEISTPRGPVTSSFICDTGNTAGYIFLIDYLLRGAETP